VNSLLTNKNGALVRKRLSELISLSGELKILVGFFYLATIKSKLHYSGSEVIIAIENQSGS
jgi:hypothetical protein